MDVGGAEREVTEKAKAGLRASQSLQKGRVVRETRNQYGGNIRRIFE